MANNTAILNRFFTKRVIRDLILTGTNEVYRTVVRRYIDDPEGKSHGEIISEIYEHIGKEKRNEYYYLNTLLNKLLVRKHNVNTTTALSQIWIGQSKADFVMINGIGHVYEIKSELDNFERLESQLRDYYKAFSHVTVVTAAYEFDRVKRILSSFDSVGNFAGVYALTNRDTRSKELSKDSLECNDFLDHTCIFKLLRKREYENIITAQFGGLPKTQPVFLYRTCLERFREIPILAAQNLAFCELKKRNRIEKTIFDSVPDELKTVVYFSDLSSDIMALTQMLETNYRG
jgi:hypothetical protein